jgi:hypothetical protein
VIHLNETLTTASVEGFLTRDDAAALGVEMDALLAGGADRYDRQRTATMHAIPGRTRVEAMAVYEPAGRIEVTSLPESVERILDRATSRAWPAITRLLPSVTVCRPWTYVEYRRGQHITAHVDGIGPDPGAWPRQIAGIGVGVVNAEEGGAFWVETTGSPVLWAIDGVPPGSGYAPPMSLARDGADNSSDWFRAMPRTRWTATPAVGTALLYGSQVTHGTEPVVAGRACKFISWLLADGEMAS